MNAVMNLTPKTNHAPTAGDLTALVRDLQRVETLNPCVLSSIAAVAAMSDPAEFASLIGDGFDALSPAEDHSLRELFGEMLS
jgi:hypothetical protein